MLRLLACALLFACQPAEPPTRGYTPAGSTAADPGAPTAAAKPLQVAAPAKPVKLALPKASGGSVSLEVLPHYELLSAQAVELNMLVRLIGSGEAPKERPPLDLAIVLDRSGSMSGEKIRSVKQAALQLLDRLTPADRVSLVSYSSDVTNHTTLLPVDERGKAVLRKQLLGLNSGGMTALGPALVRALDDLEKGDRSGRRMGHVLLMSDGIANVGETRPDVLGARAAQAFTRGVSLSTLGVGLDYNEDLMTKLADQGGGRYHFIKDGAAVAGVLSDELTGLVATVARGMELQLKAAPGTKVLQVHGYPVVQDGHLSKIRIGALGAKQKRELIIKVSLDGPTPPEFNIGGLALSFEDVAADGRPTRIDLPVSFGVTADAAAAKASERQDVAVRVAEVESAARLEVAAREAGSGNFDAADGALQIAIDDLKKKARRMKKPSPKMNKQIAEMEEAKAEVKQARSGGAALKTYTKKYKARAYKSKKR